MTLLVISCRKGDSSNLKSIKVVHAGAYTVSILSDTGTMKQGSTTYTLEFRTAADNQLVDVGTVEVAPVMDMSGMAPMMGKADVKPTGTPGRYEVQGNLSMSGLWRVTVKFGAGQSARFNLSAE